MHRWKAYFQSFQTKHSSRVVSGHYRSVRKRKLLLLEFKTFNHQATRLEMRRIVTHQTSAVRVFNGLTLRYEIVKQLK